METRSAFGMFWRDFSCEFSSAYIILSLNGLSQNLHCRLSRTLGSKVGIPHPLCIPESPRYTQIRRRLCLYTDKRRGEDQGSLVPFSEGVSNVYHPFTECKVLSSLTSLG